MSVKIEKIHLENFKIFQNITLENIPNYCVVVGANGNGKTSLFDSFKFLQECLASDVNSALQNRCGFFEVISRGHEKENIIIEMQYRVTTGREEHIFSYKLKIGFDDNTSKAVVRSEILLCLPELKGVPCRLLDFKEGKGVVFQDKEGFAMAGTKLHGTSYTLGAPDLLAVSGLGQMQEFMGVFVLRRLLSEWHVSDLQLGAMREAKALTGNCWHLSASGDNLHLVARNLQKNHPEVYKAVLEEMRAWIPGLDGIAIEERNGRLVLKFSRAPFKTPFPDVAASDGTLKFFAYLVLLRDPEPRPLLCIEEPENHLYNQLLAVLSEQFRASSEKSQIMVSTHSPYFLNSMEQNEVFWLEAGDDGFSRVVCARDDEQLSAYMAEGDRMGTLWRLGLFGKVDG